jgi:hypothetical protein
MPTAKKKPAASLDLGSLMSSMAPAAIGEPLRVILERLAWTRLHAEAIRQLGGGAQNAEGSKRAAALADLWWQEELARPYLLKRADVGGKK